MHSFSAVRDRRSGSTISPQFDVRDRRSGSTSSAIPTSSPALLDAAREEDTCGESDAITNLKLSFFVRNVFFEPKMVYVLTLVLDGNLK